MLGKFELSKWMREIFPPPALLLGWNEWISLIVFSFFRKRLFQLTYRTHMCHMFNKIRLIRTSTLTRSENSQLFIDCSQREMGMLTTSPLANSTTVRTAVRRLRLIYRRREVLFLFEWISVSFSETPGRIEPSSRLPLFSTSWPHVLLSPVCFSQLCVGVSLHML